MSLLCGITGSHVHVVDEAVALPQFLHVEKSLFPEVVDIPVVAQMQIPLVFPWSFFSCSTLIRWSTFLECSHGGDSRAPTVAACRTCAWTWSFTRPLCATTFVQSAATVAQLQCSDGELGFLGPCTQVQGRGSCPQGHGPHN